MTHLDSTVNVYMYVVKSRIDTPDKWGAARSAARAAGAGSSANSGTCRVPGCSFPNVISARRHLRVAVKGRRTTEQMLFPYYGHEHQGVRVILTASVCLRLSLHPASGLPRTLRLPRNLHLSSPPHSPHLHILPHPITHRGGSPSKAKQCHLCCPVAPRSASTSRLSYDLHLHSRCHVTYEHASHPWYSHHVHTCMSIHVHGQMAYMAYASCCLDVSMTTSTRRGAARSRQCKGGENAFHLLLTTHRTFRQ